MIGNASDAYQKATQKLSEIENRATAADAYCMRLVLANSRSSVANITTDLLPIGTPFEDFYSSAGLVSIFSQFMDDVAVMSGAEATVSLAPNAKEAMLLSLPRQFEAIRSIMASAMVDVQGFSGLHVPMADTSALADNIATLINGIGYQFAWPICLGSFRHDGKMVTLQAAATSGSASVVISDGSASDPVFGASGMSDWDKPRVDDQFFDSRAIPFTVFTSPSAHKVVTAVDGDFKSVTVSFGGGLASGNELVSEIAVRDSESVGSIYLRKVTTV